MWVNYYLYNSSMYFRTRGYTHEFHSPITKCTKSECSMMIPGTYAEMHSDYD